MTPNDANLDGLWSALRYFLVVIGGVMVDQGFGHSAVYKWVMIGAGSIMVVGPAAWGVIVAIRRVNWAKLLQAAGVQAGINMTVSGKALAADGSTVVTENNGATPPKAVTVATAQQIINDFAPPPSAIAKA